MRERFIILRSLSLPVLLISLLTLSGTALATLSATVDRTKLGEQDTLVYTLRSTGTSSKALDLTALQKDFFIHGSSRSNQISIVNGRNESWTEWNITLQPRSKGTLTIPALTYGNSSSEPITVEVSEGSTVGDEVPIIMESQLSTDTLWQGQEAVLVLDILASANFTSNPDLSSPKADGAIFKLLGKEQRSEKVIDGLHYQVITLSYVVTPTRTGSITISGQTLTGAYAKEDPYSYNRLLGGRSRPFRVKAPDLTMTVKPPPADWPTNQPWLPAEAVSIGELWSSDPLGLKVGDSITRTVTISATGVNSAQIPPLPALHLAGINSYPDQPQIKNNLTASGNVATRSESVALVPTQAGEVILPAVSVTWFNTKTNKIEVATLSAQTLTIAPGAPSTISVQPPAATTGSASPIINIPESNVTPESVSAPQTSLDHSLTQSDAKPWQWATLIFALLWLGTLAYALQERILLARDALIAKQSAAGKNRKKRQSDAADEAALFKQLLAACASNQIADIESAMFNWGQSLPNMQGQTVSDILQNLNNQQLLDAWTQLLRQHYGQNKGHATQLLGVKNLPESLRQAREQWLARSHTSVSSCMNINPA